MRWEAHKMNSCVLMAKIVRSPQLRYTQESQMAITEMMVEFDNLSPNNPPSNLKVIAWGGLATEVEQKYREGDKVILTGRLKMDMVERQGYKEKTAELTISHIYPFNGGGDDGGNKVVNIQNYQSDHSVDDDSNIEEDSDIDPSQLDSIPF